MTEEIIEQKWRPVEMRREKRGRAKQRDKKRKMQKKEKKQKKMSVKV